MLRLFAPILPFVTEEVWSWWHEGSVHRAAWPTVEDLAAGEGGDPAVLTAVGGALAGVRKAKSEAKVSMRAEVTRAVVTDTPEHLAALELATQDVRNAGVVAELVLEPGDEFSVAVTLAPPPPS